MEKVGSGPNKNYKYNSDIDPWQIRKELVKEVRCLLKKETKNLTKKVSTKITKLELLLSTLHESQKSNPTSRGAAERSSIQDQIAEEKAKIAPPKARKSNLDYKRGDVMSAELFRSTFPKQAESSYITSLNKGINWEKPPPKDTRTADQSKKFQPKQQTISNTSLNRIIKTKTHPKREILSSLN